MRWHWFGESGPPGPDDRGLAYGDGLFETIAVRDGTPRLLDRHLARLALGAARLDLPVPGEAPLRRFVGDVLAESKDATGRAALKLLVTRGDGERGYRYRRSATRLLAGVAPVPPVRRARYTEGVTLRWCRTRLGRNTALAGIKHLDRLEQVLARAEWDDEDIAEGLMLDAAGRVVCATMSNLFVVRDGRLATPALTHAGVAGVMRAEVLELAQQLGLEVAVRELAPADLLAADELFLTNSQFVLWPVARLGRRNWQERPLADVLTASLAVRGIAE